MNFNIQNSVSSTIIMLLRPIVKILLRNGIPYGTFADLAKWAYVDAASEDFLIPGKRQSISRISILTGLSRKEVSWQSSINKPEDIGAAEKYNRAGRVITGWLKDRRFSDENSNPLELPLEGDENSFTTLVKEYSGDIPVKALLNELDNVGVINFEAGKVKLLSRGYIIKKGDTDKLFILGKDVSELVETIDHNLVCKSAESFFQRKVYYDNIPESIINELRSKLASMSEEFILHADKVISKYDIDVNPKINSIKGEKRRTAGLGLYYFEK